MIFQAFEKTMQKVACYCIKISFFALSTIIVVSCVDTKSVSVPGKDIVSQSAARTLVISTRIADPSYDETIVTPTRFTVTGSFDDIRKLSEDILTRKLGESLHPDSTVTSILTSPRSLAEHVAVNDTSETSRAKDFIYQYSVELENIGSGQTQMKVNVVPVDKNAIRKYIRESNPTAVYSSISILRYWFIKDFDFEKYPIVNAYAPSSFEGPAEEIGLVEVTDYWRNINSETTTISEEDLIPIDDPESIKTAQTKLNDLDYDAGKADGKIGPKTVEAIKKFQQDMEIESSGDLNKITFDRLMGITM